jgi:DNA-binding response OmpR family regulator
VSACIELGAPARHMAVVALAPRHVDAIAKRVEPLGWRTTPLMCTESVVRTLGYDPADIYVTGVRMPGDSLASMVRWIRGSAATRRSIIIAVVGNGADQVEAENAGADYVVRSTLTARSLANEVLLRVHIEDALAQSRERVSYAFTNFSATESIQ